MVAAYTANHPCTSKFLYFVLEAPYSNSTRPIVSVYTWFVYYTFEGDAFLEFITPESFLEVDYPVCIYMFL